eukprot:TRINITY_DN22962_c0_g1_i3.p6 TRINITY_DN22962_c0_g1~~TRINITY_DN22962_c0_g1_i3.p6  ORF type:complete len:122 (-),score=1.24 TRINITY_DN22962_c0_g1_i3:1007-1372(-)
MGNYPFKSPSLYWPKHKQSCRDLQEDNYFFVLFFKQTSLQGQKQTATKAPLRRNMESMQFVGCSIILSSQKEFSLYQAFNRILIIISYKSYIFPIYYNRNQESEKKMGIIVGSQFFKSSFC